MKSLSEDKPVPGWTTRTTSYGTEHALRLSNVTLVLEEDTRRHDRVYVRAMLLHRKLEHTNTCHVLWARRCSRARTQSGARTYASMHSMKTAALELAEQYLTQLAENAREAALVVYEYMRCGTNNNQKVEQ